MTPRDELKERIGDALCEDDPLEALMRLIDEYAIGRRVPVEERLPPCRFMGDVIHTNFGQGIFIVDQKTGEHGTFMNRVCSAGCHIKSDITHWLDLDLPKQPNEQGE